MVLIKIFLGTLVLVPLITSLLLWFLPASLVWRGLEADQNLPYGSRITLPRGTLHEGYATLRFRTFPPSKISWTLTGLGLIERPLALQYHLSLEGPNHAVNAAASLQPSKLSFSDVSGFIESEDINRLAGPFGHQFSGRVDIDLSSIHWRPQCLETAVGQVNWTGGLITLNIFDRVSNYPLPALTTLLGATDCGIKMSVNHQKKTVADFQLTDRGWFTARLQPELLKLAKVPDANQIREPLLFEEKIL